MGPKTLYVDFDEKFKNEKKFRFYREIHPENGDFLKKPPKQGQKRGFSNRQPAHNSGQITPESKIKVHWV